MAGLFSRLKIWNPGEDLSAIDLNNEFNQFLANIDAVHSEGFSQNLTQMQSQEDPGDLGSENLTQPISTADEIERLRFVISRIIGLSYWYQNPPINLVQIASILEGISVDNPSRIVSGLTTALTIQPNYLLANTLDVQVIANVVPLVYYVDNVQYTLNFNVPVGPLNPAPSSNNTAILTSVFNGDQESRGATIFEIGTIGSEITSRIGKLCAFKIVNGGNTEYFIGTPTSDNTIEGIPRGFLFDTSGANSPAINLTTGHTITLLNLTYVFIKDDQTLDVTYNPITFSPTAPTTPSAGDYWYDLINKTWKKFVGGIFVPSKAAFVGLCAQDSLAASLVSRSADFAEVFQTTNTIKFDKATSDSVTLRAVPLGFESSVYGRTTESLYTLNNINMPGNLITGETEQLSTLYYIYVDRNEKFYFSQVKPIDRSDILGLYHPGEAIKAIGSIYNDSSGNFVISSLDMFPTSGSFLSSSFEYHDWEFNGDYSGLTFPFTNIDSVFRPDKKVKIDSVMIYCGVLGSGGTTEFDLKLSPAIGEPYASILTTTGSIDSTAAFLQIDYNTLVGTFQVGETVTGGTSGATANIYFDNGSTMVVESVSGTFQVAETLTGGTSGATCNTTAVLDNEIPVYTDSGSIIPARSGVTKPVISNFIVPAGATLRWDLVQSMTGSPLDARATIRYKEIS